MARPEDGSCGRRRGSDPPPGSPRDSSTTIVWSYRDVAELVDEMIEESEVDVVVVLVEEVIEDSELVRELVDVIDVFVVVVDEDLLPERDVRYTTDALRLQGPQR